MVCAGLHKEPVEVVSMWPHQTSIVMHGGQDFSQARAAHLSAVTIAMTGHGRGP
jgi:hypothetical protein